MASKYGNFKDYYKFNKVEERMKPVFEAEAMNKFVDEIHSRNPPTVLLLDIGCNAGDLTISFYDLLLERLSSPSSSSSSSCSSSSEGEKNEAGGKRKPERNDPLPKKIRKCESKGENEEQKGEQEEGEKEEGKGEKEGENKMSCPRVSILGIDIDPDLIERANKKVENRNVTFIAGDVMEKEGKEEVNKFLSKYGGNITMGSFDLVMCFSVTMWIHLNRGDEGLEEFVKFCCGASRNVLVEPQPWKCYQSAKKRSKRAREGEPEIDYNILSGLKHRENVENFIRDCLKNESFALVELIGTTKWTRNLTWWEKSGE